jgi:hypothetical protein
VATPIAVARLFRGGEFSGDLGENPASEEAGYSNAVTGVHELVISHRISTEPSHLVNIFQQFSPIKNEARSSRQWRGGD